MRPLPGYPTSIGNRRFTVFPHKGPSSYTQISITGGTVPITGGDTVQVQPEGGIKFADWFGGTAQSDDGFWTVKTFPVTPSNAPTGVAASGAPQQTFKLQWIANKTAAFGGQNQTAGTEAVATTDLSTAVVRLAAAGPA